MLCARQLYLGEVRLAGRRYFSSEVNTELESEDLGASFNSTYFRLMHDHLVVGIHAPPQPWARLRESLQRAITVEHEDYEWIRNDF